MSEKEKLNMALDDVIKLSKNSSKKGPQSRGGPKGGPHRRGGRGGRQSQNQNQNRRGSKRFGNQRPPPPNFMRRKFGSRPNKPNFNKVFFLSIPCLLTNSKL